MRNFHALEAWNRDRDASRRTLAGNVLDKHNISYTTPSKGHFKIESKQCNTLMFYPKSGTLIWKTTKKGHQHKFTNEDEGKLIRKIKQLL